MHRTYAFRIATSAAVFAVLAACGGGGGAGDGGTVILSQTGGAPATGWEKISNKTMCEPMGPAQCSGAYGFVVKHDGSFVIGPNPAGATINGQLSAIELASLMTQADAMVQTLSATTSTPCLVPTSSAPMVSDTTSLTLASDHKDYLVDASCVYNGSSANAQQLGSTIDQLRAKYYPVPF